MSYNDDEELKIGEFEEGAEDELDLDDALEPLDDDLDLANDETEDDEEADGLADLDGSSIY